MGGNVTAITKFGDSTRAEKIPLKQIGRSDFVKTIQSFLKDFNKKFKTFAKQPIWKDENVIMNGFAFNGSTSFIMDPSLSDDEVVKYKQSAGDLDITVPENLKELLFKFLDKYEDKEIYPNVKYMGSNKRSLSSIGDQINTVFLITFPNGTRSACQIDFEFLPYENDKPTEWAKFSHSSSFEDCKNGIKAVHHKLLLRALVGGASIRRDIVIATQKSTPDNIILSKNKNDAIPRMLKFSVGRGIRVAYEPLLDENGKQVTYDGKFVYKEIPSKSSNYVTMISEIFKLAFGNLEDESELKKFNSFVGVLELMHKYLNRTQIKATYERYVDLLWGLKPQRAQELEVQNPELDFEVKNAGYQRFIKEFHFSDNIESQVEKYYKDYGQRKKTFESAEFESFIEYINQKQITDFIDTIIEGICK